MAVCTLVTLAILSTSAGVLAADREGSFSASLLDAAVHTPGLTVEPPVAATTALPVPMPIVLAKTDVDASGIDPAEQQSTDAPTTTTEIPAAVPGSAATPAEPAGSAAPAQDQQDGPADYDDGVIRYERENSSDMSGPPIGSLEDFMSEGDITSPLGFEVREDKRQLKSGAEAEGLLIIDVFAGTPAARAGLHAYHRAVRDVLETAAVAGAIFFPPAVLLVPVVDQVRFGESYDLIIGVDGSRVSNFVDFEDRLRDVRAGEIVYFSILRNGARIQISVPVPDNFTAPTF
jgi:hypothetical protein